MLRSVETAVVRTDQVDVEVLDGWTQRRGAAALHMIVMTELIRIPGGVPEAHEQGAEQPVTAVTYCTLRT
jgi:hypothetical protein